MKKLIFSLIIFLFINPSFAFSTSFTCSTDVCLTTLVRDDGPSTQTSRHLWPGDDCALNSEFSAYPDTDVHEYLVTTYRDGVQYQQGVTYLSDVELSYYMSFFGDNVCGVPEEPSDDPCEDTTPDVDSDHDGICDRCDAVPDDPIRGRYIYGVGDYVDSATGSTVAFDYTYYPEDQYAALAPADKVSNTFISSAGVGDAGSAVIPDDSIYMMNFGFPVLAETSPCVCDEDCGFEGITDSPVGTVTYPGTTAPDLDTSGTTVPQTAPDAPGTIDATGEYGTADSSTTTPDSGSTDNAFLENIASNMATTTNNLRVIADLLDAESQQSSALQEQISANTAATGTGLNQLNDNVTDLNNGMDNLVSAVNTDPGLSDPSTYSNSYDSTVDQPEEGDLETTILGWISSGIPFSDVINESGVSITSADPVVSYTVYGSTQNMDFSTYESIFDYLGIAIVGLSVMSSYFIITGRS